MCLKTALQQKKIMTNKIKKQTGDCLVKWLMLLFMDLRQPRVFSVHRRFYVIQNIQNIPKFVSQKLKLLKSLR